MANSIKGFFVFLVLLTSVSCREAIESTGESGGSTGGSGGPVGEVDNAAGFRVYVYRENEEVEFNQRFYFHKAGSDFTLPCKVEPTATALADRDIECIVDIPEEDLHFFGMNLQYNVPTEMCEYFVFRPYYFYNWPIDLVGDTPRNLEYFIDSNGDVGLDTDGNGIINTATLGPGLDGITPDCPYNYTDVEGPNCCIGNYQLTVHSWDPDAGAAGDYDVTVSRGDWGGSLGSCIWGAAVETQPLNRAGFPINDIYFVDGVGINKAYEPPTPISLSTQTVFLANYYDPTEHSNTIAATPFQQPLATIGAQDSYEFLCFDRAQEVKARIKVFIREWNEYAQWELGATGDYDSGAGQNEAEFPEFSKNDFFDWLDLKAAGVDIYPRLFK
jgi:hypothetical protein